MSRMIKILLIVAILLILHEIVRWFAPSYLHALLTLIMFGSYIVLIFYLPWLSIIFKESPHQKKIKQSFEEPASIQNSQISPDAFFLEPRHQAYVRGKHVTLKNYEWNGEAGLVGLCLLGLICISMGSVAPYIVSVGIAESIQLREIGIRTQATITGCDVERDKETRFYLRYQYVANDYPGQIFQKRYLVSQFECETTELGTTIQVIYLPDDPNTWTPSGLNIVIFPDIFVVIIICVMFGSPGLVGAAAIKHGISTQRWLMRLKKEGILLPGIVLSCEGEYKGRGFLVFGINIDYVFTSPQGNSIFDTVSHARNDLERKDLPQRGRPLVILYADENCYKVL